jgi:hypothetical protein
MGVVTRLDLTRRISGSIKEARTASDCTLAAHDSTMSSGVCALKRCSRTRGGVPMNRYLRSWLLLAVAGVTVARPVSRVLARLGAECDSPCSLAGGGYRSPTGFRARPGWQLSPHDPLVVLESHLSVAAPSHATSRPSQHNHPRQHRQNRPRPTPTDKHAHICLPSPVQPDEREAGVTRGDERHASFTLAPRSIAGLAPASREPDSPPLPRRASSRDDPLRPAAARCQAPLGWAACLNRCPTG